MGWAEYRIDEYHRGAPARWLERRMLEHADPVHFPLAVSASLGIAYGLWTHRWGWILGSSALALAGHLYCWTRPSGIAPRELGASSGDTSRMSSV
jgi:hypothetical protein